MAENKPGHPLTKEPKSDQVESLEMAHNESLVEEARLASSKEQQMSLLTAIKLYPKAIGWSVLLSSTLIMEGYDLALLGSLYASPVFNQKFGDLNTETGEWVVSAAWQSGLSNGARAGEIIGLILAGWAADRYGYKMTTIGSLVLMIAFVFILFFAPSAPVLVVGEILCGMTPNPSAAAPAAPPSTTSKLISEHRNAMGRFPKCYPCVRLRSCPGCSQTLPHDLHQHVLGHWQVPACDDLHIEDLFSLIFYLNRPILCCRGKSGISNADRSLGIQDTLWCAMGLANPDSRWACIRPRVSQLLETERLLWYTTQLRKEPDGLIGRSPWWHVRHGDKESAKKSLLRLTSRNQPDFNADETIAMIEHTNELEKQMSEGVNFRDCFKGVDLRRTEIVVGIWLVQTLGGQNLMGYFAYFL